MKKVQIDPKIGLQLGHQYVKTLSAKKFSTTAKPLEYKGQWGEGTCTTDEKEKLVCEICSNDMLEPSYVDTKLVCDSCFLEMYK